MLEAEAFAAIVALTELTAKHVEAYWKARRRR